MPHLGGDVAGQRHEQPPHAHWVSVGAVHPGHVGAADLVEIGAGGVAGRDRVDVAHLGPSAPARELEHLAQRQSGVGGRAPFAVEERSQRHATVGLSALVEAHGPHADPDDPPGTGVSGDVVGRVGGACQDELASHAPGVAGSPHRVPDPRRQLPLIQQPGRRAVEDRRRIHARVQRGTDSVVQVHGAVGEPAPGPRLAAGARAFDHHRGHRRERPAHLRVNDAGHIPVRSYAVGVHRCSVSPPPQEYANNLAVEMPIKWQFTVEGGERSGRGCGRCCAETTTDTPWSVPAGATRADQSSPRGWTQGSTGRDKPGLGSALAEEVVGGGAHYLVRD